MRKVTLLLLGLALVFSLSSCKTVKTEMELSQDRASIEAVEFYYSEQNYTERDVHVFLEENEPIGVLEAEKLSAFLDAFCALEFEEQKIYFPMPMDGGCDCQGYIVAVRYSNGDYDIFSENGQYFYEVRKDGEGSHDYGYANYCGDEAWSEFIEKYIER